MRAVLTDKLVAAAKPGTEIWDMACPTLAIRVGKHRKTWVRKVGNGRQTIGHYPAVPLAKARILTAEAPSASKTSPPTSVKFQTLLDDFRRLYLPTIGPRTAKEWERLLTKHFKFTNIPKTREVYTVLETLKPSEANHATVAFNRLMSWAHTTGRLDYLVKIKKPNKEKSRDRVLTLDEIARVWKTCSTNTPYHLIVRLLILTGQRRGEIANIHLCALTYKQPDTSVSSLDTSPYSISPTNFLNNPDIHLCQLPSAKLTSAQSATRKNTQTTLSGSAPTVKPSSVNCSIPTNDINLCSVTTQTQTACAKSRTTTQSVQIAGSSDVQDLHTYNIHLCNLSAQDVSNSKIEQISEKINPATAALPISVSNASESLTLSSLKTESHITQNIRNDTEITHKMPSNCQLDTKQDGQSKQENSLNNPAKSAEIVVSKHTTQTTHNHYQLSGIVQHTTNSTTTLNYCTWQKTKNGSPHTIPISKHALTLINQLHAFLATTNTYNTWGKPKKALDKASGVTNWCLHDLRRSFATHLSQTLKVDSDTIEKLLNHTTPGVRGIYNRDDRMEEMRIALERWEALVLNL